MSNLNTKSPGSIRIANLSLRLRGVTPQQAEQRARSIAREIADSLAGGRASLQPGQTDIPQMIVRVKSGSGGSGIAEQVRGQLAGGQPRE
jgi:hypothetical protein